MPRALVVINEACHHKADVAAPLEAALADARLEPEIAVVEPAELDDHICTLDTDGVDRIISVGGDGTLRTVAECAIRHDLPLGIIPLGTMNLLAKDLGVPLDLDAAIAVACATLTTVVDVGRVNGDLFLHSSVLGIVPRLGRWRERIRKSGSIQDSAAHVARAATVLGTIEPAHLTLSLGDERERVDTFALAVSVGPIAGAPPEPLKRPVLSSGRLALYLSRHQGRPGLVQLLTGIGMGLWGIDAQIEDMSATSFTIDGAGRRLLVSNDGEVKRMDAPLRYEIVPRAMQILVPPPAE